MNEEILQAIKETVEEAVDVKINGKLRGITAHLGEQDKTLEEMKELMEERKFLLQLWSFVKFIGGIIAAVISALILYRKL